MKRFYFIFGALAVKHFDEGEIKETAKVISEGDGMLANIEAGDHPGNLLAEFEGWDAWLAIGEDEYLEINKLINV